MKKNVSILLVVCVLVFNFQVLSHAEESKLEFFELPNFQIKPLNYGWYETHTVVGTAKKAVTVEPTNQPKDGFHFNTGGMVGFYEEQGQDVSVSVSVGYENISFTVKTGAYVKNGGSVFIWIPAGNERYKVKLEKVYEVTLIKVDCYDKGQYKYSYYTHRHILTEINGYAYRF